MNIVLIDEQWLFTESLPLLLRQENPEHQVTTFSSGAAAAFLRRSEHSIATGFTAVCSISGLQPREQNTLPIKTVPPSCANLL